jgi:hypothetical protein
MAAVDRTRDRDLQKRDLAMRAQAVRREISRHRVTVTATSQSLADLGVTPHAKMSEVAFIPALDADEIYVSPDGTDAETTGGFLAHGGEVHEATPATVVDYRFRVETGTAQMTVVQVG